MADISDLTGVLTTTDVIFVTHPISITITDVITAQQTAAPSGVASPPENKGTSSTSKARTFAIVGGVVGGILGLLSLFLCARYALPWIISRRRSQRMAFESRTNERSQRSAELTYVLDRTAGSEHGLQAVLNQPGNVAGVDVHGSELEDLVVQMRSMEARLVQQAERGIIAQPASRPIKFVPQDTSTQQSMVRRTADTSVPSAQAMSLVLQEIQSLRTRMDEIVRHQQQEAARNFSSTSNDFDDGRTGPPSYSEGGVR